MFDILSGLLGFLKRIPLSRDTNGRAALGRVLGHYIPTVPEQQFFDIALWVDDGDQSLGQSLPSTVLKQVANPFSETSYEVKAFLDSFHHATFLPSPGLSGVLIPEPIQFEIRTICCFKAPRRARWMSRILCSGILQILEVWTSWTVVR